MMMRQLSKAYLYKNLIQDLTRMGQRTLKSVDFDKEAWLHKAGLASYRPGRSTFSGLSLLVLGGIAGAVTALLMAPSSGSEIRTQVKERATKLFDRVAESTNSKSTKSSSLRA